MRKFFYDSKHLALQIYNLTMYVRNPTKKTRIMPFKFISIFSDHKVDLSLLKQFQIIHDEAVSLFVTDNITGHI